MTLTELEKRVIKDLALREQVLRRKIEGFYLTAVGAHFIISDSERLMIYRHPDCYVKTEAIWRDKSHCSERGLKLEEYFERVKPYEGESCSQRIVKAMRKDWELPVIGAPPLPFEMVDLSGSPIKIIESDSAYESGASPIYLVPSDAVSKGWVQLVQIDSPSMEDRLASIDAFLTRFDIKDTKTVSGEHWEDYSALLDLIKLTTHQFTDAGRIWCHTSPHLTREDRHTIAKHVISRMYDLTRTHPDEKVRKSGAYWLRATMDGLPAHKQRHEMGYFEDPSYLRLLCDEVAEHAKVLYGKLEAGQIKIGE